MKFTTLALCAGAASAAPRMLSSTESEVIEGEYVIAMKATTDKAAVSKMASNFFTLGEFSIGRSFKGFTARLTPDELASVMSSDEVDMVSPNVKVYATGIIGAKTFKMTAPNVTTTKAVSCPDTQQAGTYSWGQSRVTSDTNENLLTKGYAHDANWGEGVDLYVTDTGTLCSHEDFAGRSCECGPDFSGFIGGPTEGGGCADGNGHGTFCSSIAAGNVYGVAKNANLIGVKVLGDRGSGTLNGIIGGFDWVAEQAAKSGRPSVCSVSLGTQGTNEMVDAAANALAENVLTAIAAGNAGQDPRFGETCTGSSPGAAEIPITVGSSTDQDGRSFFSNYGECNDIYAPGSDITGAYSPGDQSYITGSGTSMATPHVAGAAAALLSEQPSSSAADIKAALLSSALQDVIDHDCAQAGSGAAECEKTPNALLHLDC